MIAIIDYGMGNLGSIRNMLRRLRVESMITRDESEILRAEKIILPGVGSFDQAVSELHNLNLIGILNERVLENGVPVLGICLGMQVMTKGSEEGALAGLGWIDARTIKFKFCGKSGNLKVPHMGWNTVRIKKDCLLSGNPFENSKFYFSHSYHVTCDEEDDIAATTDYGYDFVSMFQKENIMGVQFHPEKSHKFGMKVLKNFMDFKC